MLEINVASCSRSVEQPALPTLSLSPESQLGRQTLLEVEFLSTPTGSVDASLLNKEANSLGFTVITRMHLVVRTVESKHARNVWLTENGVTLISEKDGAISRGAFRWSSLHVYIHCQKIFNDVLLHLAWPMLVERYARGKGGWVRNGRNWLMGEGKTGRRRMEGA